MARREEQEEEKEEQQQQLKSAYLESYPSLCIIFTQYMSGAGEKARLCA
jgi:hypothetical protein